MSDPTPEQLQRVDSILVLLDAGGIDADRVADTPMGNRLLREHVNGERSQMEVMSLLQKAVILNPALLKTAEAKA